MNFNEYLDNAEIDYSKLNLEYDYKDFDRYQKNQIAIGLLKNLDISLYAKPFFDWEQMQVIRWGLEEKINVDSYADPKYNGKQMEQIWKGLVAKVDVSDLLKKRFGWKKMMKIVDDRIQQIGHIAS